MRRIPSRHLWPCWRILTDIYFRGLQFQNWDFAWPAVPAFPDIGYTAGICVGSTVRVDELRIATWAPAVELTAINNTVVKSLFMIKGFMHSLVFNRFISVVLVALKIWPLLNKIQHTGMMADSHFVKTCPTIRLNTATICPRYIASISKSVPCTAI